MIRMHNIKLPYGSKGEEVLSYTARKLGLSSEALSEFQIVKKSIDARKKPDLYEVYTVDFQTKNEEKLLKKSKGNDLSRINEVSYSFDLTGREKLDHPPVIIGAGPAGLFCALELARAGYHPILLERGKPVEERILDVEAFWKGGQLLEDSNVSFGEGGAGTFSDGKLNTVVKDPKGRNRKVLEEFIRFGAREEIRYEAKPHVGTDVLLSILKNMRKEILSLGGQIRFESRMSQIEMQSGHVKSIRTAKGEEIPCEVLVLAIGNSARDTFTYLAQTEIAMESKPFAVGFRVEHSQEMVNRAIYGENYKDRYGCMPAANYKLTAKTASGKGVYSFCMCPGGYVVNASSEKGCMAVNGMSYADRDGSCANSAIVVAVNAKDFGSSQVLAGMEFQRQMEKRAFLAGNGKICQQRFVDYVNRIPSTEYGEVKSCLKGQGQLGDLSGIFSEEIRSSFLEGMAHFQKIMPGFGADDVILSGIESRTSSPIRLPRNENFVSNIDGIYPCGEGAGYAGGIISAAMDGLRIAQAIASVYRPE